MDRRKFPKIVQRIYNAIFVSDFQICRTRTKRPGKNSTRHDDLNTEHQKELSKVVHKMEVVPLGPKRVKLSQIKDYKSNWQHIEPQANDEKEEIVQM